MNRRIASCLLVPVLDLGALGNDQIRHYDVTGSTAQEVYRSMDQLKPADGDGIRHQAVTLYAIRWSYRSSPTRNGCAVTTSNVVLDVSIVMPKWTGEATAPLLLAQSWQRYYSALLEHERAHRAIAVAAAASIREAAGRVTKATCPEVDREVNNVGNGMLAQLRAKQRQFDAETSHGQKLGVQFP